MRFRDKYQLIDYQEHDILVITESENSELLEKKKVQLLNVNHQWFSCNGKQHKGLSIINTSKYRLSLAEFHNPDFKLVIPMKVERSKTNFFYLYAIWANNPSDSHYRYVGQIWKAITQYRKYLESYPSILIGDFNSNKIWDKPWRNWNHTDITKMLEDCNIYSCYHVFFQEKQGEESQPTLFMYRKQEKPYHIDYCYASKHFIDKLIKVEVGKYDKWIDTSDHMPMFFQFSD